MVPDCYDSCLPCLPTSLRPICSKLLAVSNLPSVSFLSATAQTIHFFPSWISSFFSFFQLPANSYSLRSSSNVPSSGNLPWYLPQGELILYFILILSLYKMLSSHYVITFYISISHILLLALREQRGLFIFAFPMPGVS